MKKEILYKQNNVYNWKIEDLGNITPLSILAEDLRLEVRQTPTSIDDVIDWYKKDHGREVYRGGYFCIVTLNDQSVIIASAEDPDLENEKEIFRTTKDKMIQLLEAWKAIMQMNPLPNKIVFTQADNGDVTINVED